MFESICTVLSNSLIFNWKQVQEKILKKLKCWLRLLLLSRFLPLLRGQLKHICYNFTALYLLIIIIIISNSLSGMVCEKSIKKNSGSDVDIGHLKYPASLSMSARLSDTFKYIMWRWIYALSTIYQCFLNTSSRICWIKMSLSEVWHLRISSDKVTQELWSMTS